MPIHNRFFRTPTNDFNPAGLLVVGAVVPIEIHVPPQLAEILTDQGKPIPAPVSGLALVDTGATTTCVHEPVLQQLGLNPVSLIQSGTANGPVQQSQYPARLVALDQGWTFDINAVTWRESYRSTSAARSPSRSDCTHRTRSAPALGFDLERARRILDSESLAQRPESLEQDVYFVLVQDADRVEVEGGRLVGRPFDHRIVIEHGQSDLYEMARASARPACPW